MSRISRVMVELEYNETVLDHVGVDRWIKDSVRNLQKAVPNVELKDFSVNTNNPEWSDRPA